MLRRHHSLCSSWHHRLFSKRCRPSNSWDQRSSFRPSNSLQCKLFHTTPCTSAASHALPFPFPARHQSTLAKTKEVSEAQRRVAELELGQMTQSTSRLLAIKDSASITDAIVNEARVALHYWSRRWYMHFHPGFGRAARGSALNLDVLRAPRQGQDVRAVEDDSGEEMVHARNMSGDFGARQAELILDWATTTHNLIPRGIFNLEGICSPLEYELEGYPMQSPNMTCVNIIDTYLLPCGYNGVGGYGYRSDLLVEDNQRHYATLSKHYTTNPHYIKAVADATRVLNKMKGYHNQFEEFIMEDTLSVKAKLNVWSKRSMVLAPYNIGGGTGGIVAGNVVMGHHNAFNPVDMLKSQEEQNGFGLEEEFYTLQGCLNEMEQVLARAEEQWVQMGDEKMKPSVDWYNHVLGSWARCDLSEASMKTKQILSGMEAYDGLNRDITSNEARACYASPDIISYNSVLFCLARNANESRAKEALSLFQKLQQRYEYTKNEGIRPDEVTYGTALHALAQVGMAHEAEHILDKIEEEYGASDAWIVPTLTIYNTVLNAWANSFERSAPRRAEFLLQRMKNLASTGKNPEVEPDTVSISTVMSCHARSKRREGAERAEELLEQAVREYKMGNGRVKPDSIMFNCAILGWAQCSSNEGDDGSRGLIPAERAELLIHKLRTIREDSTLDIHPMAQTFNIVLDSWAKSERSDAAERALALMAQMPELGVTPDECSYNSVLHSMSKQEDPVWVKRAQELFNELKGLKEAGKLTISALTYNVMINNLGKSRDKDGARKAEDLLRTMENEGVLPGLISYNSCIDAYARRGDIVKTESLIDEMIQLAERGRDECRPTIHSFASLVNAIANSGKPDAVERAESVVRKVEELDFVRPNTVLYNSLINTIVKSEMPDSSERAERVLKRMDEVRRAGNSDVSPDSFAYSMVLTLCARSKERGAAIRALDLLDSMEELYSQGHTDVIANTRCYSAVITAWARSGSPDTVRRAFELLDRMERNKLEGSPHASPNSYCYNCCIHAIAKSSEADKVKYCVEILRRMNEAKDSGHHDCAPTLITYSTIINACAYATVENEAEKRKAFELARMCLQTLLDSPDLDPDESTFANFFLVMCRHLGKGEVRDRFAEAVFREACKQGKVERQVLYHFKNASPSTARRLLPAFDGDVVPVTWAANVRKLKRRT